MTDTRPRFSTQVSEATQSRVRATVRGIAQVTNTDYTLSRLVEDALDAYCTAYGSAVPRRHTVACLGSSPSAGRQAHWVIPSESPVVVR